MPGDSLQRWTGFSIRSMSMGFSHSPKKRENFLVTPGKNKALEEPRAWGNSLDVGSIFKAPFSSSFRLHSLRDRRGDDQLLGS